MNRLASSTKKAYCLLFLSLTTLLFLLVFIPMRRQLEYQVAENYSLLAESKRQTIMTLINNCITNANSLSSRTVIRDYIELYNEDRIEWEALQNLTQPKYNDGLQVISDLSLAIRCVDRQPLIVTGEDKADYQHYVNLFDHIDRTEYVFDASGGKTQIVVCSPITSGGRLLGHDIIVVDISEHLRQLAQNGFTVKISDADSSDTPADLAPNTVYHRYAIEGKSYTLIVLPIDDRYLFWVDKPTPEVFENLNRISLFSIVGFVLGLVVIFIILQISIIRLANSIIAEIGDSRDAYMRDANYDALTGAFTRSYFDNWIKGLYQGENIRPFIVGMADIDCFKNINDSYGHRVGDQVLDLVAKTLIEVVDRYGFVVRFGGDEFITVCEDDIRQSHNIFDGINQRISQVNPFDFKISISYGTQRVDNIDAMYSAIEMADKNMYRNKKGRTNTKSQTEHRKP